MAATPAENLVNFPSPTQGTQSPAELDRSFAARWKHPELFSRGYLVVPTLLLHHYAHLKPYPLSLGELVFVLHLMSYKWDANAPYPSYKTLAKLMGVTDKMVRRHAQSLETKKYLKRVVRVGATNQFDLTPLFDALLKAVESRRG